MTSRKLFSSARERRLWLWTLAVVVAIYSTLGLARTLNRYLVDRGLVDAFFFLALFLVLATILTQGLETRPRGAEIAVGLGVATAYLLVFLRMLIPEHRSHLIEYSVLGVFVYAALSERAQQGRHVPFPTLTAILLTSGLGTIDELIQAVLPSRVFDPVDILFNLLAGTGAVLAVASLGWARRRRRAARQALWGPTQDKGPS